MEGMIVMIKVTTLLENTADPEKGYVAEHGLSFHIEGPFGYVMFDTGQSGGILQNARAIDIDLGKVDKIAISHGHYDHAGGVRPMIENGFSKFSFFVGEGFFNPKYSTRETMPGYNGVDFDREYLAKRGIGVEVVSSDRRRMAEGVWLVKNFKGPLSVEPNPVFKVKKGDSFHTDDFSDEICMVLEGRKQIVMLSGCAHPGIESMVEKVMELFDKPLEAVIGGTHLVGASEERLEAAAGFFGQTDISRFGFSHCTGENSAGYLKKRLGNRFMENHTGDIYVFD